MAIQVKAVVTVAKTAVTALRDEEKRKKLLFVVLSPVIFFILLVGLIINVLTSPLEYLAEKFGWSEKKIEKVEETKNKMTEYFPLENVGNIGNILQEGTYPYPIVGEFRITSKFGYRSIKIGGINQTGHHNGVDFSGIWHTPIISIDDGIIVFSGKQNGYGNCIMIRHDNFYSFYAHLSKRYAIVDQKVRQYDIIGLEGGGPGDDGRGTTTGHHLHFEIRMDGTKKTVVDPLPYLTSKPTEEKEKKNDEQ